MDSGVYRGGKISTCRTSESGARRIRRSPWATALARAGIVTNANAIPFDPRKPFDPSGVRIGTPAVTTRGLQEDHMAQVAEWINEVVASAEADTVADRVRAEVHELMGRFPAPGCRTLSGETV